jgi:ElaA protein
VDLRFEFCRFADFSLENLYRVLALRQEVFVVGQGIRCVDADGDDQQAWHLLGWKDKELVAYLRVLPPGVRNEFHMIGRVLTAEQSRGLGYGKQLMRFCENEMQKRWAPFTLAMNAQHYLLRFYEDLGYRADGEIFIEEGLPHIFMRKEI